MSGPVREHARALPATRPVCLRTYAPPLAALTRVPPLPAGLEADAYLAASTNPQLVQDAVDAAAPSNWSVPLLAPGVAWSDAARFVAAAGSSQLVEGYEDVLVGGAGRGVDMPGRGLAARPARPA
jgi:hypothetical protein